VSLPEFIQHILEDQLPGRKPAALSAAERALLWRESAKGVPYTPPRPIRR
jgi:hypothetical protein